MSDQCTVPVIFLVFNRPEMTQRVFDRIREAKPQKLFVVCDGPRENHPDDKEKTEAVKRIIDNGVDWPCDLRKDYASKNLGCRKRVSSGITKAFEQVDRAVILEDDCLPHLSFFHFCRELLEEYKDDESVFHINGSNFAAKFSRTNSSYRISNHSWMWGWATWRRAWQQYDFEMSNWETLKNAFIKSFSSKREAQYWLSTFKEVVKDIDAYNSWAYPWKFTCRSLGKRSLMPSKNLIENLGFVSDSTHDMEKMAFLRRDAEEAGPITDAPNNKDASRYLDDLFTRVYSGEDINTLSNFKARLRLLRERLS